MLKQDTRELLKALAPISDSMILKYPITGINQVDKSIIAFLDLEKLGEEEFDTFGIYKIGEFLSLLDIYADSDISLADDVVTIQNSTTTQRYVTTHINNLEAFDIPTTVLDNISKAPKVAEVTITKQELENIKKISNLLKLPDLTIETENNELFAIVNNASQPGMNDNKTKIGAAAISEDFKLVIDMNQISKLPSIEYDIEIAKNPKTGSYITLFKAKTIPLKIVVSVKPD